MYSLSPGYGPIANETEADGCPVHRFDTGQNIMLEATRELAEILLATAVYPRPFHGKRLRLRVVRNVSQSVRRDRAVL